MAMAEQRQAWLTRGRAAPIAGLVAATLILMLGGPGSRTTEGRASADPTTRWPTITVRVSDPRPAPGSRVTVACRVRDRRGRAIRAARVVFVWRLPGTTLRLTRWTGADGRARTTRPVPARSSAYEGRVSVAVTWHGQRRTAVARFSVAAAADGALLQPGDLVYQGAFRLPDPSGGSTWEWGGDAIAIRPGGDPSGPADGYPGSLFGTGHAWDDLVSEVTIPTPVISADKNVDELPSAVTLQPFNDVRGGLFADLTEIRRVGMEYLPAQGAQTSDKLYLCWGQHMQEGVADPSHMWCDLDLAEPHTAGPWAIGDLWSYVTSDYLFAIPASWAADNTPGMLLATGRFRDGGQGAEGPSLIAIGPWNQGISAGAGDGARRAATAALRERLRGRPALAHRLPSLR